MPVGFMPTPIPLLISLEVGWIHASGRLCFLATLGIWPRIAMFRMKTIVNVAAEIIVPAEPRPRADEDAAGEPLRAIVSGRRASIGSRIVVAIRTFGGD